MKVMNITWIRNSRTGEFSILINAFRVNEEMMTIAIFMKLFVISIVARRRSGDLSTCNKSLDLLVFFAAMADRSDGEREKYATSDPEAKAEPASNTAIQMNAATIGAVTG